MRWHLPCGDISRFTLSRTSRKSSFRRYLMPSRRQPICPVTWLVIWDCSSFVYMMERWQMTSLLFPLQPHHSPFCSLLCNPPPSQPLQGRAGEQSQVRMVDMKNSLPDARGHRSSKVTTGSSTGSKKKTTKKKTMRLEFQRRALCSSEEHKASTRPQPLPLV